MLREVCHGDSGNWLRERPIVGCGATTASVARPYAVIVSDLLSAPVRSKRCTRGLVKTDCLSAVLGARATLSH